MNALATALWDNSTVTEINLRGSKISNNSAKTLHKMLEKNEHEMIIGFIDNPWLI